MFCPHTLKRAVCMPGAQRGSKQGTHPEVELRTVVSHHVAFLGTCVCSYPRTCMGTHVWGRPDRDAGHFPVVHFLSVLRQVLSLSLNSRVQILWMAGKFSGSPCSLSLRGCPESQLRSVCFHSRHPYPLSYLWAPRYVWKNINNKITFKTTATSKSGIRWLYCVLTSDPCFVFITFYRWTRWDLTRFYTNHPQTFSERRINSLLLGAWKGRGREESAEFQIRLICHLLLMCECMFHTVRYQCQSSISCGNPIVYWVWIVKKQVDRVWCNGLTRPQGTRWWHQVVKSQIFSSLKIIFGQLQRCHQKTGKPLSPFQSLEHWLPWNYNQWFGQWWANTLRLRNSSGSKFLCSVSVPEWHPSWCGLPTNAFMADFHSKGHGSFKYPENLFPQWSSIF